MDTADTTVQSGEPYANCTATIRTSYMAEDNITSIKEEVYNELSLITAYRYDADADGVFDYFTLNEYDDNGNTTLTQVDLQGSRNDHTVTITYTDDNLRETWERDDRSDGTVDQRAWYDNQDGLKMGYTYDQDNDGKIDIIASYTYNEADLVVLMETRTTDGALTNRESHVYTDDYLTVETSYDNNGDEEVDYTVTITSDEEGRILERYTAYPSSFYETVYTYDDNGWLIMIHTDSFIDGVFSGASIYEYIRDAQGREERVTWTNDIDPDSTLDDEYTIDLYDWSCP